MTNRILPSSSKNCKKNRDLYFLSLKNDVNVGTSLPDPDPYVFGPLGSASGSVKSEVRIGIRTKMSRIRNTGFWAASCRMSCGVQVHDTVADALGSCAPLHGQYSVGGAQKDGGAGTSGRRQRTFWPGEGGGAKWPKFRSFNSKVVEKNCFGRINFLGVDLR